MNFKMESPTNFTYDFEHIAKRRAEAESRLKALNIKKLYLSDGKPDQSLVFPEGNQEVMNKVEEILLAYGYSKDQVDDATDDPTTAIRIALTFVTQDYYFSKFFDESGKLAFSNVFNGDESGFNPEDYQFDFYADLADFKQKSPFVSEMELKENQDGIPEYTIDEKGEITKQYPMMMVPKADEPGTIGIDALAIQGRFNITPEGELVFVDVDFRFVGMPGENDPVSIFIQRPLAKE